MSAISYVHTLPAGQLISLENQGDGALVFQLNHQTVARLRSKSRWQAGAALALETLDSTDGSSGAIIIGAVLHALFESVLELQTVSLDLERRDDLAMALYDAGFALKPLLGSTAVACPRSLQRQKGKFWLDRLSSEVFPLYYSMTDGKRHPIRPPVSKGRVYSRYFPELQNLLSFRTINPEGDVEVFHRWMNDPRVANFWELEGSLEQHTEYLARVEADAHIHPVFGCFDGEPFGYFELYWAKEDRIAPYYPVDDYDRGIHMLVGEARFRGPHRVAAWLSSLAHFLFLDDPRTRNVVAEPRADNAKMIGYMQRAGFHKAKEFDFPHKRAAMMVLPREVFFGQFCP